MRHLHKYGCFVLYDSYIHSMYALYRSRSHEGICTWPEQWLSVVIRDLTEAEILPITSDVGSLPVKYLQDDASAAYCATRRSAGLPFFVQVSRTSGNITSCQPYSRWQKDNEISLTCIMLQALLVVLHKTGKMGDALTNTVNALLEVACREVEATTVPAACQNQASLSAAEVCPQAHLI